MMVWLHAMRIRNQQLVQVAAPQVSEVMQCPTDMMTRPITDHHPRVARARSQYSCGDYSRLSIFGRGHCSVYTQPSVVKLKTTY